MVITHHPTSATTTATATTRAPWSTQCPGRRRATNSTAAMTAAMTTSGSTCSAGMAEILQQATRLGALLAAHRHGHGHAPGGPESDRRRRLDLDAGQELESRQHGRDRDRRLHHCVGAADAAARTAAEGKIGELRQPRSETVLPSFGDELAGVFEKARVTVHRPRAHQHGRNPRRWVSP